MTTSEGSAPPARTATGRACKAPLRRKNQVKIKLGLITEARVLLLLSGIEQAAAALEHDLNTGGAAPQKINLTHLRNIKRWTDELADKLELEK